LFYKGLDVNADRLYWEWDQLALLVDAYALEQCQGGNNTGTPGGSGSGAGGEIPLGEDIWNLLALPWVAWNDTA